MFNYKYNIQQGDLPKYINGQELGEIADYKYGNYTMAQSGCGVIAAYNAISLLGGVPNMPELIRYFEQNGMVMNAALGTNPYSIGNYFKGNGYEVENITHNLDDALTGNNVIILTSWIDADNILQGSHTVAIEKDENGQIVVYNPYGNSTEADDFASIKDYLKGRSLITGQLLLIMQKRRIRQNDKKDFDYFCSTDFFINVYICCAYGIPRFAEREAL